MGWKCMEQVLGFRDLKLVIVVSKETILKERSANIKDIKNFD